MSDKEYDLGSKVRELAKDLPKKTDLRDQMPPVGDQGAIASSTAFAMRGLLDDQQQQHSDEIDRKGHREWEGEHKVEITAAAPTWDTKLTIDGRSLSSDVRRIEIDIDVDKLTPIMKLTRFIRDEDGRVVSEEASLKTYTQQLVMSALDLTSDEMLVLDTILESARKAANSEQLAVQLFAINATEEGSDETVRITLDALLRDAKRFHALSAEYAAGGYLDIGVRGDPDEATLEAYADYVLRQQRERPALREQQRREQGHYE